MGGGGFVSTATHTDTIREALDQLEEAAKGWIEDNPYERAVAPARAALDALVARVADLEQQLANVTETKDALSRSAIANRDGRWAAEARVADLERERDELRDKYEPDTDEPDPGVPSWEQLDKANDRWMAAVRVGDNLRDALRAAGVVIERMANGASRQELSPEFEVFHKAWREVAAAVTAEPPAEEWNSDCWKGYDGCQCRSSTAGFHLPAEPPGDTE